MSDAAHLVIGPDEHGVVRHALAVADACRQPVLRAADVAAAAGLALDGFEVVHLAFTDRLFADSCEQAAVEFGRLARRVAAVGAALSVTLHDVPRGESALAERRRAAYRSVVAAARGVVVCSGVELAAVQDDTPAVHSLRLIPLPIDAVVDHPVEVAPGAPRAPGATGVAGAPGPVGHDVVVLGFVFPDRGYESVLRELPAGTGLLALGRAARGHEDLPAELARQAAELGRTWRLTGFLPDAELAGQLRTAGVPVAPNPRVGASGSIGSWLAHGRRVLVPRTAYTEELAARMPGCLWLYDQDRPGALRAAVAEAHRDPSLTWLPAGSAIGPGIAEVAAEYRAQLAACVPPRLIPAPDGGPALVPGNRWDLLPPAATRPALVSVVIPYYDDQARLDLVLAALREQSIADRVEVIVADDGSPEPPDLTAAGELSARVVRQQRRGFGAARARNLGAGAARGELLAFLDGDTVPEPDYLERLAAWPWRHRQVLAVGRRRHADFTGWSAAGLAEWVRGCRDAPPELTEPDWLRQGYRTSANLLDTDARGYRFVISATLAVYRELFDRIGGFDERFDSYGGEDWEFANRAWHAGALFVHEPAAVAWHDGPDWADRAHEDRRVAKNTETAMLSRLLPDPELRGGGQWLRYPQVVVRTSCDERADVLVSVRSALAAGVDCGFWLTGDDRENTVIALDNPFVHAGQVPPDVLARAAVLVDVELPCDLGGLSAVAGLAQRHGLVRAPALLARSTRALSRCGHHDDRLIERLFGRHDLAAPLRLPAVRLDRDLPRLARLHKIGVDEPSNSRPRC